MYWFIESNFGSIDEKNSTEYLYGVTLNF